MIFNNYNIIRMMAGASRRSRYPADVIDSNVAAAYSLRVLKNVWKNEPVIRVRRSSDDDELDITSGQIDDGTLTTFCGGNDGFVTRWYDQTGNGRTAQQTVLAFQPRIVIDGIIQKTNSGHNGIFFPNINSQIGLLINDVSLFRNVPTIQGTSFSQPSRVDGRNPILYASTPAGGFTGRISSDFRDNAFEIAGRRLDQQAFMRRNGGSASADQEYVMSFAAVHAENKALVKVNGSTVVDESFQGEGLTSDTDSERITIGGGSTIDSNFRGLISEVIISNNAFSGGSDMEKIHANLTNYYLDI